VFWIAGIADSHAARNEPNTCDNGYSNPGRELRSYGVPNFYVYIMASKSRVLYAGVTSDIRNRVWQRQHNELPGFTSKYRVHRLVYFERFQYVTHAIAREKEIKG
jgi:predicted GIY-YIG superfamily endonuclease